MVQDHHMFMILNNFYAIYIYFFVIYDKNLINTHLCGDLKKSVNFSFASKVNSS